MAQTKKQAIDFIQVYTDFNNWLYKLGFKSSRSSTPLDYHYSDYNEKINDVSSVEHYVHEPLRLSLRFLRDRNKHQFLSIDGHGGMSELIPLEEFKDIIKNEVIRVRDERLAELNNINVE